MKLWFVLGSGTAQRFVEPVIFSLLRSGHDVHVSYDAGDPPQLAGVPVSRLETGGCTSAPRADLRGVVLLRAFASYVELRARWRPLMRRRWLEYFPSWLSRAVRVVDGAGLSRLLDNPAVRRLAMAAARAVPTPRALARQLDLVAPDVVVVTPMIYPGTRELDVVTAARARGVPSAGIVLSWDNLTSKATFHDRPDLLLVWNQAQREEALAWHRFPADSVDALGAPVFDHLFELGQRPDRQATLAAAGLDAEARYVLYGVSSRLGLGPGGEVPIVRRLAAEIETLDWAEEAPVLLVRPHPRNAALFDRPVATNVLVMAPPGFPDTEEARRALHGLLAHADAVVGLNTSLFVEAAIVGTPTVAMAMRGEIEAERMPSSLTHFDHLVAPGFLHLVDGPAEAASALVEQRLEGDSRDAARAAFVEAFVRPLGNDRPAADLVAERLIFLR